MTLQVSIVAMQRGEQLMPFKTKSGDTLEILYMEELSAQVSEHFILMINVLQYLSATFPTLVLLVVHVVVSVPIGGFWKRTSV